MGRKTITVPEPIYDDLDYVNRDDESFGDTIARLIVADEDAGSHAGTGEHSPNTLTVDHIEDIAALTAQQTAAEVENRLTRR